jgi:beta-glucosidase/6-phospho-beta-glucosidase/beta-galactosidase
MNEDSAAEWLAAQWAEVSRLREEGLPIRGFTWYGLVNHVDWDSVLVRDDGRENACGLVSLDRRPNKTYEAYRRIAEAELERVEA